MTDLLIVAVTVGGLAVACLAGWWAGGRWPL